MIPNKIFLNYKPLKEHASLWVYRILLATMFLAAWHFRSLLPPLPFMDPDTPGYLSPAAHLLSIGTYVPTWRNFLYPLFLAVVLWFSPHLETISWTQHFLGLVTAGLIILILLRSRVFLPKGKLLDWTTRLIVLIAVYIFLFSHSTITLEHSIRPEALFAFTSAVSMLTGLEFSRCLFLNKHFDRMAALWAILLIIVAIGTYYVKSAWGFAAGTSLLPLAWAWLWVPRQWVWKSLTTLSGLFLAIIFFVLPQHFFQKKIGENIFLPPTLLCTHAEFLSEIIQTDALRLPPKSSERAALLQFVEDVHAAIKRPHFHRYGLALDPDELMYRGPWSNLEHGLQKNGKSLARFCYYYYFRAWQEHPSAMLWKVEKQMEYFYSPKKLNVYAVDDDLHLSHKYQESLQCLPDAQYLRWAPMEDYLRSLRDFNLTEKMGPNLPHSMQWLIRLLNATFSSVLFLNLIAAAAIFLGGDAFYKLRPAALVTLYYSSFNFANCLTISIVCMMNITRYHFNQITMSLVSQGFGVLFLIALINDYLWFRMQRRSYQNTL